MTRPDTPAWRLGCSARLEQAIADPLLSVVETSDILGIQPGTLYKWIYEGRGPEPDKTGATGVRFRASMIRKWIEESTVPINRQQRRQSVY